MGRRKREDNGAPLDEQQLLSQTELLDPNLDGDFSDEEEIDPDLADMNDPNVETLGEAPMLGGTPHSSELFGQEADHFGRANSPKLWASASQFPTAIQFRVWRMENGLPVGLGAITIDATEEDLVQKFYSAMPKAGDGRFQFVLRPIDMRGKELGKEINLAISEHHATLQWIRERQKKEAEENGSPGGRGDVYVTGQGQGDGQYYAEEMGRMFEAAVDARDKMTENLQAQLEREREELRAAERQRTEERVSSAERASSVVEKLTDRMMNTDRLRSEEAMLSQKEQSQLVLQTLTTVFSQQQTATREAAERQATMQEHISKRQREMDAERAKQDREFFERQRQEMESRRLLERQEADERRRQEQAEFDRRLERDRLEAERKAQAEQRDLDFKQTAMREERERWRHEIEEKRRLEQQDWERKLAQEREDRERRERIDRERFEREKAEAIERVAREQREHESRLEREKLEFEKKRADERSIEERRELARREEADRKEREWRAEMDRREKEAERREKDRLEAAERRERLEREDRERKDREYREEAERRESRRREEMTMQQKAMEMESERQRQHSQQMLEMARLEREAQREYQLSREKAEHEAREAAEGERTRRHEMAMRDMELQREKDREYQERLLQVQKMQGGGGLSGLMDTLGMEAPEVLARIFGASGEAGEGGWGETIAKVIGSVADVTKVAFANKQAEAEAVARKRLEQRRAPDSRQIPQQPMVAVNTPEGVKLLPAEAVNQMTPAQIRSMMQGQSPAVAPEDEELPELAKPNATSTEAAPADEVTRGKLIDGSKVNTMKRAKDAGIPLKTQRDARKAVRTLLQALEQSQESEWPGLVTAAITKSPDIFAYLQAVTVFAALAENKVDIEFAARIVKALKESGFIPDGMLPYDEADYLKMKKVAVKAEKEEATVPVDEAQLIAEAQEVLATTEEEVVASENKEGA